MTISGNMQSESDCRYILSSDNRDTAQDQIISVTVTGNTYDNATRKAES